VIPAKGPGTTITRPPDSDPAAAFPFETHEGSAPIAIAPSERRALVDDPLPRVIARLALPAVLSNVLMTLFFTVDSYWVGTRVGSSGLAAVTTSMFWIWGFVAIAEMVSIGLTAVAARRHGERNPAEAARIVGELLRFTLLLGAAVAVTGLLTLDYLFAAMGTPPDVTALGKRYLGTYLLGAPLVYGFFAVDAGFRAAGDTRTPFLLLAGSVAVTIVLDPLLILGWGPFPQLGIAGAALATVSTRSAAFVIGLMILIRRGMLTGSGMRLQSVAAVARIGLPTALTGVLFSVIYIVIARTATQFGTPAIAALGVGHRVESWIFMIGVGFGVTTAAIVGQNLGAGRSDRAARAGWLAVSYASAPAILACVVQLIWPERLAGIFTNDPAVIAEGARYLRIAAISQLFVCSEIVLEGALGGAGATLAPMFASTILSVARIPLAAWAALKWGTVGIWWVISLTAVGRGVAMMILWKLGRWKRIAV
jgi:putative MATE family efflux protein